MSGVQNSGLRDPDMQRALAEHLRLRDEAKKHPNPERDREQLRRLVRWVQSRVDICGAEPTSDTTSNGTGIDH